MTMTPEEYIEQLKDAAHHLQAALDRLDDSIYHMQRRMETGYEYCEKASKKSAAMGAEDASRAVAEMIGLSLVDIEY